MYFNLICSYPSRVVLKNCFPSLVMVHPFNLHTREAEAGGSVRPTWSVECVWFRMARATQRKAVSKNQKGKMRERAVFPSLCHVIKRSSALWLPCPLLLLFTSGMISCTSAGVPTQSSGQASHAYEWNWRTFWATYLCCPPARTPCTSTLRELSSLLRAAALSCPVESSPAARQGTAVAWGQ